MKQQEVGRVEVPLEQFIQGKLPNVCALSGALARENYMFPARSKGGPVPGAIPLTAAAVQSMRSLQRLTRIMFLLSAATMAVGIAAESALFGWIALVLLAGAGGYLFLIAQRNIKIVVTDNETVVLSHVHPNFAKAVLSPSGRCGDCTSTGYCSNDAADTCHTSNENPEEVK